MPEYMRTMFTSLESAWKEIKRLEEVIDEYKYLHSLDQAEIVRLRRMVEIAEERGES